MSKGANKYRILDWRAVDWLPITASALLLVVTLWTISSVGAQPQQQTANTYRHLKNEHSNGNAPTFFIGIGAWITRNRDYIEVGSTFAVGAFTALLFLSTTGLWVVTSGAARDARRGLVEIERAFVFCERFLIDPEIGHDGHVRQWIFSPILKNSGTTPTSRLYNHVSINLFDKIPTDFSYPDLWDAGASGERISLLIGPKADIRAFGARLHIFDLAKVKTAEKRALIWGWIEYDDVFDGTIRHRTEFCNEIIVTGDLDNPKIVPFALPIFGAHNGADQDCMKQAET